MSYERVHKPVIQASTIQRKDSPATRIRFAPATLQRSDTSSTAPAADQATGLPNRLKSGIERLSGISMDDVRVHRNSSSPQQFQAHAYAKGTDIHLASGQEQHLPHEAWHVVQQKQGRVQPDSVQGYGAPINDNPALEQEADRMGALAASNFYSDPHAIAPLPMSHAISQSIMQRKKVPTDFGEFETTTFAAYNSSSNKGVTIVLKFNPDEAKIDAKKIALSQSVRKTDRNGSAYAVDPTQSSRMVKSGKPGAGYRIDRISEYNNPIYGAKPNLTDKQELKDTPISGNTSTDPTELVKNTVYELGHCYKEKETDATKKKYPAGLYDQPQEKAIKGISTMFETTALAIDGTDKDTYYGSVKWGYKMEGTDAAPTVTTIDIESASMGNPTVNFIEAAKLWNSSRARGTLQVTADPATVEKLDGSSITLPKGTKLEQKGLLSGQRIKAEVMKDGTAMTIKIKNTDFKDMGDGVENKQLPIPK